MSGIFALIAVGVIAWMASIRKENEAERNMERIMNSSSTDDGELNLTAQTPRNSPSVMLMQLAYRILSGIGCQPTIIEGNNLEVRFQGELFLLCFGGRFIRIWDPSWLRYSKHDPDKQDFDEAINLTNFNFGPCIVKDEVDEEGTITLSSRMDIVFPEEMGEQNLKDYLRAMLTSFFNTKKNFHEKIHEVQEAKATANEPLIDMSLFDLSTTTDGSTDPEID